MNETYRFGPFELDTRTAELRRNGELLPLQPQPAAVLGMLVRHAGDLVTREEIQAAIWPDRVVDYEQGLNYAVRQIRALLDDDADAPRFVETLPRRGYRFVAPVECVASAARGAGPRSRRLSYALAALLLVALVVAGLSGVGREYARVNRPTAETPRMPVDPAARESFLIAQRLVETRDKVVLDRARREFTRVLDSEPDFEPALVGIGEALLRSGEAAAARAPLERALGLDPADARAHHLLAQVLLFHAWEWDGARHHLSEALRLGPGQAATHQVRAYWHAMVGDMSGARAAMDVALRLDPLSSFVQADAGWIDYWDGRLDDASTRCARTIELDPASDSGRMCLLFVRIAQDDMAGAGEAARDLMQSRGATAAEIAAFAAAPAAQKLAPYWSWEIRRLAAQPDRSAHDAFLLGLAYAEFGRDDEAFRELEIARRQRSPWMLWLAVEPRLAPLRDDPRWPELVRRMAFPPSAG